MCVLCLICVTLRPRTSQSTSVLTLWNSLILFQDFRLIQSRFPTDKKHCIAPRTLFCCSQGGKHYYSKDTAVNKKYTFWDSEIDGFEKVYEVQSTWSQKTLVWNWYWSNDIKVARLSIEYWVRFFLVFACSCKLLHLTILNKPLKLLIAF